MPTIADPVSLVRKVATGVQRCFNRVQLEDVNGSPILWPATVRPDCMTADATPVITAGAYAANDAIGGLLTFQDVILDLGGYGMITRVVVIDLDAQNAPLDIFFWPNTVAVVGDNAPFTPADAVMEDCIGYISIAATDYSATANNSIATKCSGLQMPFEFVVSAGTRSLFAQAVVRNATPTYTATDHLIFKIQTEMM
jgi:hypothetical protein